MDIATARGSRDRPRSRPAKGRGKTKDKDRDASPTMKGGTLDISDDDVTVDRSKGPAKGTAKGRGKGRLLIGTAG